MKDNPLHLAGVLLLFCMLSGCASFLSGGQDVFNTYEPTPYLEEGDFAESWEIDESYTEGNPPVYIATSDKKHIVYANVPTQIQIYTPSGSTKGLEVTAYGGQLDTIDASQGLYSFIDSRVGTLVEIVAYDPVSMVSYGTSFSIEATPPPSVYVWQSMKRIPTDMTNSFSAESFKLQNALVARYDVINVSSRCFVTSFELMRIGADNTRETVVNDNQTGAFNKKTTALVAKAKQGDIYVFRKIMTNCSETLAKDIFIEIN